ncbi:hypothetical protein FACS1894122_07760 [Alphaproteobacteria bacterium]|nr:hypothetical protein FACS1894122_07760 [Alphaproteobacteria bacterium]
MFSMQVVRKENPYEGGSARKEHRKSDVLIVVKKPGNAGGAKGSERYCIVDEWICYDFRPKKAESSINGKR